jgi:NAD(P)-dependent dehydrogenase (short-subunit alcohol dehydrogenase family)
MSADPFSIAGRRVVIVGGTAGIGYGVAKHFADAGADVVISGRRADGDERAAAIGTRFVKIDVSSDVSVETGIESAVGLLGGLDVLILNAGIAFPNGSIREMDLDAFRTVVDVNLVGVLRGMKFGVRHMGAGGVILVTSSPGGRQALGMADMVSYSASKAAVDMLVQTAGLELGREGIRVTGVLPGLIRTEINGEMIDGAGQWFALLTATGEAREPKDLGATYQFLASDAAHMLKGAIVAADDGCSAGLSGPLIDRLVAKSPEQRHPTSGDDVKSF